MFKFAYPIVPSWHDNDTVISFPLAVLFLLIHFHHAKRSAWQHNLWISRCFVQNQDIRWIAYRRLASELHPNLSGIGSERFLEPQEAYSVLSDPMRRAGYDREAEEIPVRHTDLARPVVGTRLASSLAVRAQVDSCVQTITKGERGLRSAWTQGGKPTSATGR